MSGLSDVELPTGWSWATLGDMANSVKNGIYVSRPGSIPDGVPILRISAVRPMQLSTSDLRYTGMSLDEVEAKDGIAKPGDLLFTRYNGNVKLVGACARVPDHAPVVAYPDKLIRVALPPEVDSRFLCYAWAWAETQSQLRQHVKTTAGQAGISGSSLKAIRLPLAPLAEQHRIVESIEDHFSHLDAAVRSLSTAQVRSRSLQKSAVERVMNGGFPLQSDEDEPVHALLKRVETELSQVAKGKRRKATEPNPLSAYASPPSHWSVQPLGSLARKIEYGTSAKAHADRSSTDVPVLRMGNIQDGRLDLQDLKYLPAGHPDAVKLSLSDGDLLFNRTNSAELVGKSAVYRSTMGSATFASYLIRCQLVNGIEPEWVSLCINSPEGRRYINSVAAQQVGQANVNGTKLASFPIPLPPHGEQLRLLAELQEWKDAVTRTTTITQRALGRSVHLRRSLLTRAFTGQLVPQDPTDEPASVLLDRIRAEREAQGGKVKRGTRRPRKAAETAPPPAPASTPSPTNAVQQELPL